MLRIYLQTAFRQLYRNRIYASINIIGLATGITAMLLAILFWRDEESFDNFHQNAPQLYRVTTKLRPFKDKDFETIGGAGQVQAPAFKAAIPEIKSYTRVFGGEINSNVIAGTHTFKVLPLFVESNFLEVFSFPVIHGNPATALEKAESVVITASTAKKFFGTTDVLGKLLTVDADPSFEKLGKPLVVSAVVKDPPRNSSLQFDLLYSFPFFRLSFEDENWMSAYMSSFLVLQPGSDLKKIEGKFAEVFNANAKSSLNNFINSFGYNPEMSFHLQPIKDIHLNPLLTKNGNQEAGVINGSDKVYSVVFLSISGFILLMAAINFININLAVAIRRSKEVGVRKIAGGSKWQIVQQFLVEASMLCLTAFLLSIALTYLTLPLFNELTGKAIQLSEVFFSSVLFDFILLNVLLIAVTSLYPAFILSKFRPAEVLYNRMSSSHSGGLRKALVVVQFIPAVFLLIVTLVYYRQMNYMREKDLGYNPSQVITTGIYGDRDYASAIRYLKNEMAKNPLLNNISFGSAGYTSRFEFNGKSFEFFRKTADENFLPLMEIDLLAGRNFVASDAESGIIVNEAFIRASGIDYAPGAIVNMYDYNEKFSRRIVGVVKDYHYASPRLPILPMVIFMKKEPDGDIWVKTDQANTGAAIKALEKMYKAAMPGALFEYSLLDEANIRDFVKEKKWQRAVTIGTALAFVICWLGLFGLAHLSTYQRIKEIGIRKVLGASLGQVVMLLTGHYIKLVLIAVAVASPVAWIVMDYWLNNYAYHIHIGWWVFLVGGTMALSITFISVSYQSFRAALSNPVKTLRTE